MAKVLVNETYLSGIGNAIRSKTGGSTTYKPSEMAAAIRDIDTSGYPEPTGTINITQNGTANVKDYASASVNVPNSYGSSDEGKVVNNGALVAQGSHTITQNGTYDTTLISELIANISGGGGSTNILSGTGAPTASVGEDGDVYLQILNAGIKNTVYGQCINTGYSANTNSKLVCDFLVTEEQISEYPTIFGARPNTGNTASAISWHMAKYSRNYSGATVTWQNEIIINGIGVAGLLGKTAHVELENGLFKLTAYGIDVEQALTEVTIASSTPIFLFQMGVNGSASSFGQTKGIIIFNFKIYENDILIHNFVPAKDTNDIVCLYDEVVQEYKYPDSGTMEYVDELAVAAAYCKVNGTWQNLIGTNINDVNLGD